MNSFPVLSLVDVLSNELINFMKMGRRDGYNILAVDNNPYKWVFRMHRFETDTDFYSDLTVVDSMYDYSFVEFQFEFAMDLYPMYPPTISICRPRFEGFMQGKIANLWTLKIDHWHPISGLGKLSSSFVL